MNQIQAVILAAGKGSRMKTNRAKPTILLLGIPMLSYIIHALMLFSVSKISVVLGYKRKQILPLLPDGTYVFTQKKLNGTAKAIECVALDESIPITIILPGDSPLITVEILETMKQIYYEKKLDLLILTTFLKNPKGYGILELSNDHIPMRILEEKDRKKEYFNQEVNTSIYFVNTRLLKAAIQNIKPSLITKEYYLTEIIPWFYQNQYSIDYYSIPCPYILGINDKHTLIQTENYMKSIRKEDFHEPY